MEDGSLKKTILFVPGFAVDTYSEIEASYIDLCAAPDPEIQFVWLVSEISAEGNQFVNPANRGKLSEPVWVSELRRRQIPYVSANIRTLNVYRNLRTFAKIFREYRIDAVYTHFGIERYWATFFGKLLGKKTIWNEHWHSLDRPGGGLKRMFYRIFVDEFIAVSRFIARTLPRTNRVHTVLNAIRSMEGEEHDVEPSAVRARYGIEVRCKTLVLMVAAFRAEKRHFIALEVCQRVLQERSHVAFLFLGEGPLRYSFLTKVKELALQDRIFAPGYSRDVELAYAAADICMLTSLNEPFGYCVLEAMKHGLPIVVFDSGGPAEIVRNEETGVLIPEGDVSTFAEALVRLVDDSERRRRIGRAAARSIESDFNRSVWITRLQGVIRQIVSEETDRQMARSGG